MLSRISAAIAIAAIAFPFASASAQDAPSLRDAERSALRVQHLLASARDTEPADRVVCVDRRLSEIHSTLRLALSRGQHLAAAERRGDRVLVDRERALLARLVGDVRRLELEARACVDPEPALASGRTQVTVIIEPWVPELDVATLPR